MIIYFPSKIAQTSLLSQFTLDYSLNILCFLAEHQK